MAGFDQMWTPKESGGPGTGSKPAHQSAHLGRAGSRKVIDFLDDSNRRLCDYSLTFVTQKNH